MTKVFDIVINFTENAWGYCYASIEAETAEEARELFGNDPWAYDWEGWDTYDSEMIDWEVEDVKEDEWSTKKLLETIDKAP